MSDTRTYTVPGISCDHCKWAIEDKVAPLTGVDTVEIDVEEGLRSKAVSEAVYESGKCGQVVKVADVLKGKVDAYQRDVDRAWKLV